METLARLIDGLTRLEDEIIQPISVTLYSEYQQIERHLNNGADRDFDFVLLDRDCKSGGSFHVINLELFSKAVVIGISSVPQYNRDLLARGVNIVVDKDYKRLDEFADKVMKTIKANMTALA